jgi:hypothetical protein
VDLTNLDETARLAVEGVDLAMTTFGPLMWYGMDVGYGDYTGYWPPNANDNAPVAEQPVRKGDWMQTFSGRQFWPMDPRPEEVFIEDIAHALAMQCRYAGHCRQFYSVAEHSVHLARYALRVWESADLAMWALLHDASEAYLVDVPRPVKPFLPGYKDAEARVMDAVCDRFGLPRGVPRVVHEIDGRIIADERTNMAPCTAEWADSGAPLGIRIEYWRPEIAEIYFLDMFSKLKASRGSVAESMGVAA